MDIFIVVYSQGNRRIRSTDPISAWNQVNPGMSDVKFKRLTSNGNKYSVLQNDKQVGQITHLSRGRGSS